MTDKKTSTDLYIIATATGQIGYANVTSSKWVTDDKDVAIASASSYMIQGKIPYFVFKAVTKVEPITPSAKITEL